MINDIFAAPLGLDAHDGLAFAMEHNLGFELTALAHPEYLDDAESVSTWHAKLQSLKAPLALHGPFYDLNPASSDATIATATHARYQHACDTAKHLGCQTLIFQTQYSPAFTVANWELTWRSACTDFWQTFAQTNLGNGNLTVLLKNFMENDPEQLRKLVDDINHPNIKACFDTGHANIFSEASPTQWLEILGHQVTYVHANNNHGHRNEQRGFLQGNMDMDNFLNHVIFMPNRIHLALAIADLEELKESYAMVERYKVTQQQQLPEKSFLI